ANDVTTEIREADVVVSTSSYGSATVQVRQEPAEGVSLSLSYGSAEPKIDSEGGTYTVSIECNCDWTAALESAVDGWELTVDATAGTVTITAEPNSGDAITGNITVSASLNGDSASETVAVTQISRDDNPYFRYTGYWNVNAADAYYEGAWYGQQGTYTLCSLAEYFYPSKVLSLVGWGGVSSLQMDRLQYKAEDNTVTIPMGFLCGTVYSSFYEYYMYFVAFNEALSSYYTGSDLVLTISDDGQFVDISGVNDDYPVIGYVGYNAYKGYVKFSNVPYCKAPLSLTKSEDTSTSSFGGVSADFSMSPVENVPEGVPERLPVGTTGEILSSIVL
ncbi:MAG: BACON domain-containing protein, partial [Clostridia bacterium]|nr:BACON domain-containing protein [Clostridia bacterium]